MKSHAKHLIVPALVACALILGSSIRATLSEPDHIFYGNPPEPTGTVTVSIGANPDPVASYDLGSVASYGGYYVLRIPMDSVGTQPEGTARPGDDAFFYFNDQLLLSGIVGEQGSVQLLDLSGIGPTGVSIDDIVVAEGDTGVTGAVFELTLDGARPEPVVVHYEVVDNTANQGEDFVMVGSDSAPGDPERRSVEFAPGVTRQTISFEVLGDQSAEANETFFVNLSEAEGAPISRHAATCTIVDDDGGTLPVVTVADVRVGEGDDDGAELTVRLTPASEREVTVYYSTADGPAQAGDDFVHQYGTLVFSPGETARPVHLAIVDDEEAESLERFKLRLTEAVHARVGDEEAAITIMDDDGDPAAPEVGRVFVAGNTVRVELDRVFDDPVVLLGPPTRHGADVVVATVERVESDGFDVRLLGGSAAGITPEEVDYLVMERGRHLLADGSFWEVGTLTIGSSGTWVAHGFTEAFPASPAVLLTLQEPSASAPVAARARQVTASGFETALFDWVAVEDEVEHRVSYLAVYSQVESGTIQVDGVPTPYLLQSPAVDVRMTPVLSWSLRIQRSTVGEATGAREVARGRGGRSDPHGDTTGTARRARSRPDRRVPVEATEVSVLVVGRHLFATDVSDTTAGPLAIRSRGPEFEAAVEWGTVLSVDDGWKTIPLARRYTNPVVVATPLLGEGTEPVALRVRNVTEDAFEVRCSSWSHGNDPCEPMAISYLVAEEGNHSLAGLQLQAGLVETSSTVHDGWESAVFSYAFDGEPVVLAGLQTDHAERNLLVRIHDRNAEWFGLSLQSNDAEPTGPTAPELVGWIAIEPGTGTTSDDRLVHTYTQPLDNLPASLAGPGSLSSLPVTLAGTGSMYNEVPSFVCFRSLAPENFAAFLVAEGSDAVAEDVCFIQAD